ncbi:hypothetical protein [Streptomyces sp. NPDC003077]|uniref:Hsp70 family protein n=1 Tax=Streptomyces sp. NPDC003077 TaxID=3154443 RepID=UPI0033AA6498
MTERVVAAIDFGTHGTGYAWAVIDPRVTSRARMDINDRTQWDDDNGILYPKTRTALLLRGGEVDSWGHSAVREHQERMLLRARADRERARRGQVGEAPESDGEEAYYQGMKMSLRSPDDPARRGRIAVDDGLEDPAAVIAKFLREIVTVAVEDITSKGIFDASQIRWCLTVPAIWDDWAKAQMRTAAIAAGLPDDRSRLLLLPEPDAAALYCDVTAAGAGGGTPGTGTAWRPGMRFVVVDCGGGTVDLVSYRVDRNGGYRQLCVPTGGPYGAEYTTRAFLQDSLSKRFGRQVNLEELERTHWAQIREILLGWEQGRNRFRAEKQGSPLIIQIPYALFRSLGPDMVRHLEESQPIKTAEMLVLDPAEVRGLLDTSVDQVIACVEEQLDQWDPPPDPGAGDALFLVGGFAQSPYLRERVRDRFGERLPVRVAQRPERAVLFGAVHYCYNPTLLRARRAKYTYGCGMCKKFVRGDPREHLEIIDGEKWCTTRFKKFVTANQEVPVDHEVRETFLPTRKEQDAVRFDLYSTYDHSPRYITDPGVKKVGTLSISLRGAMHLPRDQRRVILCMTFGQGDVQVRAVNAHTGTEATTSIEFESVRI